MTAGLLGGIVAGGAIIECRDIVTRIDGSASRITSTRPLVLNALTLVDISTDDRVTALSLAVLPPTSQSERSRTMALFASRRRPTTLWVWSGAERRVAARRWGCSTLCLL
jgi:hypothetical protein